MISGDVFLVVFVMTAALLALGAKNLQLRTERDNMKEVAMKWRARAARPCERCNTHANQEARRRQEERRRGR